VLFEGIRLYVVTIECCRSLERVVDRKESDRVSFGPTVTVENPQGGTYVVEGPNSDEVHKC